MRQLRIYAIKLDLFQRPGGWRRAAIVGLPSEQGIIVSVAHYQGGPQRYADRVEQAANEFVAGRKKDRVLLPPEVVTEIGAWDAKAHVVRLNPRHGRFLEQWICHPVEADDLEAATSTARRERHERARLKAQLRDVEHGDRLLREQGLRFS